MATIELTDEELVEYTVWKEKKQKDALIQTIRTRFPHNGMSNGSKASVCDWLRTLPVPALQAVVEHYNPVPLGPVGVAVGSVAAGTFTPQPVVNLVGNWAAEFQDDDLQPLTTDEEFQ